MTPLITPATIARRAYWVEEIKRPSGRFGDDSDRLQTELNAEIAKDGLVALLDHLRLCGVIPEVYRRDSSEEKLYSKYTDAVLSLAFSAIGLKSHVVRGRADSADVEAVAKDFSLVADAKAFRLSRTAKNQKDFKVQAMDGWKRGKPFSIVVGPIYQLPPRSSQIYEQASARNVCVLSYSHLAVLASFSAQAGTEAATKALHQVLETVPALNPNVWLGTGILDGNWHRIERDLSQIVATQTPGVTFTSTTAISVWSTRCYIDDMRFSNTVTVEQNVLGAGVVGHILRNRSINKLTGATADRWFHYDQVGSVISESDASGLLAQVHHQDAFGNTQSAWNTGLWGGDKPGWHHNTKEYDGDTGLVYMYQRWYSGETGTFLSSAPYPVMMEHRYGIGYSIPTRFSDPTGRCMYDVKDGMHRGIIIYDPNTGDWYRADFSDGNGGNPNKNKSSRCFAGTFLPGEGDVSLSPPTPAGNGPNDGLGSLVGPNEKLEPVCVLTPEQAANVLDFLKENDADPPTEPLI